MCRLVQERIRHRGDLNTTVGSRCTQLPAADHHNATQLLLVCLVSKTHVCKTQQLLKLSTPSSGTCGAGGVL